MDPFNRRSFLFASSGAAVGTFAFPGLLEGAETEKIDYTSSGLVTGQPKPLRHLIPKPTHEHGLKFHAASLAPVREYPE